MLQFVHIPNIDPIYILCLCSQFTVKPRKFELRFFEILANTKLMRDTLNSDSMTQFYKKHKFWVRRRFFLSSRCYFYAPKLMFDKTGRKNPDNNHIRKLCIFMSTSLFIRTIDNTK